MIRFAIYTLGVLLCGWRLGVQSIKWAVERDPELAEYIGEHFGHHAKRVRV